MTNIWGFLIQTLEVSAAAGFLLILKELLSDKLSPRWQYGIWSVLLLKAVLPAGIFGYFLSFQLASLVQALKTMTELSLESAFTTAYSGIGEMEHVLPYIAGTPTSFTDWLFIAYLAGVIFFGARYVVQYGRLRRLLRKSAPVTENLQQKINETAERYGLKPCRAVYVPGISSAFVCGIFSPVLAVPEGSEAMDEKILLHELLHLRSKDALQTVAWTALRVLHWCNPFLWYVTARIGNDMESLCDQRVLEKLEGEERRAYGRVLLSMTNDAYARAPGTTSISNGGKNIARRIKAIAHFKKYPKGMAVVSICIGLCLTASVVIGDRSWAFSQDELQGERDSWSYRAAMADASVKRCGTVAGAVDTWVKGVVFHNPVYVAAATAEERQAAVEEAMEQSSWGQPVEMIEMENAEKAENDAALGEKAASSESAMGGGKPLLPTVPEPGRFAGYCLYNLKSMGNERYEGQLQLLYRSDAPYYESGLMTISIEKKHGWAVSLQKDAVWKQKVDGIFPRSAREISAAGITPCKTLTAEGETGTAAVDFWTVHLIGMRSDQSRNNEQVGIIGATSGIDMKALPDAVFLDISGYAYRVRYQAGPETNLQKGDGVGMDSVLLTNGDEDIQALFHKLKQEPYSEELWHQTLQTMQGSRRIQDNNFVPSLSLPKGFAVRIYKENEPYYGTGSLVEEISTVSAKGGTAK